ncbi:MAG: hypothetical protein NC121_02390 [Blautia sp.]|nr:hypothetical protein [Blautia sp.]
MKKILFQLFLAVIMLAALLPMRARAAGREGIRLDQNGTVTVVFPQGVQEKISSLSFSLAVDSADMSAAEFQFKDNLAEILEFRYDSDAHKLNVYVAGTEALFAEGTDSLTVGTIRVLDKNGRETAAKVSVVEDSLQYVNGTELLTVEEPELPGTVQIGKVPGSSATPAPGKPSEPQNDPDDSENDPELQQTPTPAPAASAASVSPPAQTNSQGGTTGSRTTAQPQNTGGGSGNVSVAEGGNPSPAVNSAPTNTPGSDQDGVSLSEPLERDNAGQAAKSKGSNLFMVVVAIVVVIAIVAEITAFVIVKKKGSKK